MNSSQNIVRPPLAVSSLETERSDDDKTPHIYQKCQNLPNYATFSVGFAEVTGLLSFFSIKMNPSLAFVSPATVTNAIPIEYGRVHSVNSEQVFFSA